MIWDGIRSVPTEAYSTNRRILTAFAQGAEIDDYIERGEEDGIFVYEAEIERGNTDIGVTLSETGEILEIEEEKKISWEQLPLNAQVALDKIDSKNRPDDIKLVTKDGNNYYDAGYALKGSGRDVILSVDGDVVEIVRPIRGSRLPLAILEEIAERYPGATIKEAELQSIYHYEITLIEDGKPTEIEALATGEIDDDNDEEIE